MLLSKKYQDYLAWDDERRKRMSWYSDGEKFDEHEPEYCQYCSGGNSYEECQRCQARHEEEAREHEDWKQRRSEEM